MREWVQQAERIVALTGAGISVASGLPTIATEWRGIPLREVFAARMFVDDPEQFYACYRDMLLDWRRARPNAAHRALADPRVRVITQNVDGLHQEAGTREVLELHGNLRELVCLRCAALFPAHVAERNPLPHCPTCGALLKPHIVLEGEEVLHLATAINWVAACDLLVVVGTSLEMQPVAQLPMIAAQHGVRVLHCNRDAETELPAWFAPGLAR